MEFIEATLNPNFLPKRALKRSETRSQNMKQKWNKKTEMLSGCTAMPCLVFLHFALLGAWGFLDSLIFLEIAREVFVSIET